MSKGVLLFAHNNRQIDYGKSAYIAAKFVKKNLNVPVSLVTDTGTVNWLEKNDRLDLKKTFDKIILSDDSASQVSQPRRYYDGSLNYKKAEFKNGLRAWAYELSPYENTLVIDVDLLIVNDYLNPIWDSKSDFMINKVCHDLSTTRDNFEFQRINDLSIDFYWATAFFFRKTGWTKTFFGLCQHIVENYNYYRFVYRIDNPLLRNDYVFSIAVHLMSGFNNTIVPPKLPAEIYYCLDRDELFDIKNDKTFLFLIEKKDHLGEYTLAKTQNQNVHIMNKFSLDRWTDKLLEIVDE